MTYYDRNGNAAAYCNNGVDIYLFNGNPVAHIKSTAVYSISGRHLGWCDNGWIRDLNGNCVMYSSNHYGGPVTPVTRVEPVKSVQKVMPVKSVTQVAKVRSVDSFNWSNLSVTQFFNQ